MENKSSSSIVTTLGTVYLIMNITWLGCRFYASYQERKKKGVSTGCGCQGNRL